MFSSRPKVLIVTDSKPLVVASWRNADRIRRLAGVCVDQSWLDRNSLTAALARSRGNWFISSFYC
jgi:hypothetical protein